MSTRAWSTRQLRRMPELRHFDQSDPLALHWGRVFSDGAMASRWTSLFALTGWTIACLAAALLCFGLTLSTGLSVPNPPLEAVCRWVLLTVIIGWLPGCILINSRNRSSSLRHARRTLRSELRRRGIPICIACGYEGGTIDTPRCPECGVAHANVA